jgi:RNA polymerase sigma factor (sigma-70 family)
MLAELLVTPPPPGLCLVAQHFMGMALKYDYLSTGKGHRQSHKAIANRRQIANRFRPASLLPTVSDQTPSPLPQPSAPTQARSFSDAEQHYIAHVSALPRLSSAEEYSLAKRMCSGDLQARNALVKANLGLVVMFARRHARPGLSLLDLVAEGNLGLFASASRFDPEMGFRFATYAKWWVLHEIRSAVKRFNESNGIVSSPSQDEPPSDAPPMEWPNSLRRESETATGGQAEEHNEETSDPDCEPPHRAQLNQRGIYLRRALAALSEREQAIVSARYALGEEDEQTLSTIAKKFNLSIERIRQIEQAALQKLAQALSEMGVSSEALF